MLEDETMRVKMEDPQGKMKPGGLVNGVVAGVWGREAQGGKFAVKEVFFSGLKRRRRKRRRRRSRRRRRRRSARPGQSGSVWRAGRRHARPGMRRSAGRSGRRSAGQS